MNYIRSSSVSTAQGVDIEPGPIPPGRQRPTGHYVSARDITRVRRKSRGFIEGSLESLNCSTMDNQIRFARESLQTFKALRTEIALRLGLFILTGVLTGFLGVFMTLTIHYLGLFEIKMLEDTVVADFEETGRHLAMFTCIRFVKEVIPIIIGVSLVIFIAPYAAGGGIAQSIGYLNGIDVPDVLCIKGLVVKALSTVCSSVSGLAAGKEEPMFHMGSIIGGRLPSAFPWLEFRLDQERRDFAAAGFGAGIAVAFRAPIGGLLFALEEVSSLELNLMWKIYVCCFLSYAVGTTFLFLFYGADMKLNNQNLLIYGVLSSDVTDYEWFEVISFALMAVFGGLLGVLFIKIHVIVSLLRDQHINTKAKQMIAALVVVCFVVFFQVSSIWLLRSCSNIPQESQQLHKLQNSTKHFHQLYCTGGKQSDMSVLFSKTHENLLRMFFGKDRMMHASSIAWFAVIYFIMICMTMSISISAGIFTPQIILGAAWGRLFGIFLNKQVNDAKWARPAKYAYIGAAAQLSGTAGKTFSILVILVEASGSINLSFPLMVVVSITRYVGALFNLPIFETQMSLLGFPFLPQRPPPVSCNVPVTKCMSEPPLITLPPSPTVSTIIDALEGNDHNGFPIVKNEKSKTMLIGLILRQQLLVLLKCHAYRHPTPINHQDMVEYFKTYMKNSRKTLNYREIIASVNTVYYNTQIDLSPHYNRYPSTVLENLPMTMAYKLFRKLGIRHLVVVTTNNEPVGMVTRKDLAVYQTVETFCRLKVQEKRITQ